MTDKSIAATNLVKYALSELELTTSEAGFVCAVACAWFLCHSAGATETTINDLIPSIAKLIQHHAITGLKTAKDNMKGNVQ